MIHSDRREAVLFVLFLVTVALTAGCSGRESALPDSGSGASSETAASGVGQSPELKEGEREIDRRVYSAQECRTHTIESDLPVLVGFRTNFSDEMESLIRPHKNMFGREVSVAAELSVGEPRTYAGSNHGGVVEAVPVNGTVEVEMQSYCRGPLEILLYTRAADR